MCHECCIKTEHRGDDVRFNVDPATNLLISLSRVSNISLFRYLGTLEGIASVEASGERRTFQRFNIEVPARVDVLGERRNRRRFYCQSFNISAGGVFLNTKEPLPEDSDVEIELILFFEDPPDAPGTGKKVHILAKGKILRRESDGLVVRFTEDFEIAIADPRTGKLVRVAHGDHHEGRPVADAESPAWLIAIP